MVHTENAEASGHEEVADDSESEVNFFTEGDGDEDGEEGQDEEEEAGHGAGGGLLHDYGEEEGEEYDEVFIVKEQEEDEAGVGVWS